MKTHTIKTPTAELLIVELQTKVINSSYHIQKTPKGILIKDDTGEKFISNKYTLLGKPDEISEKDAEELVERISHNFYKDYADGNFFNVDLTGFGAKESLLSLIESEIYWKNPEEEMRHDLYTVAWEEAEQKTFDRNRSLIFKKNRDENNNL